MELFERLVRYETELWNAASAALVHDGTIGLATLLGLRALQRHPGAARVQEVSEELAITASAASKFVDRLERDGLVARQPNPTDRRSSLLTRTSAGEAAAHEAETSVRVLLDRVLVGTEADRLQDLLDALEARLANVRAGAVA